jgi:hypothetical protein
VWAFAKANMADAGLFARLASEITRRRSLDDFTPQALANTVWAFAKANMADAGLFARLASEITRRRSLDDFTPQNLANTVWAFAVADEHAIVSLIIDHVFALSEGPSAPSWSIESISQLHQAVLQSSAAWHAHLSSSRAGVVEEWRQARCLHALKTSEPSQLQRQVYRALRELEVEFTEEFIVSELGYSVDARLLLGTDRKVVLVDGPSHFVTRDLAKPSGLRETGATFLKHRQLKRAGWTVVQVPYWEWDALTRAQQAPYLRDKLALL